eukprot:scaffold8535_cov132-Cylindrotheca_fusiformis.AAC.11
MSPSRARGKIGFFLWFLVLQTMLHTGLAKLRFPFKSMLADASKSATEGDPASFAEMANAAAAADSAKKNPFHFMRMPEGVQYAMVQTKEKIANVLLYQPPVGIVAVWTIYRLVKSGRLFRLHNAPENSEQALVNKASRLDYHTGRALDLDLDDEHYQKFGGVERVRRRLALRALKHLVEQSDLKSDDRSQGSFELELIQISLLQMLNIQFPPAGSHGTLVQKMIDSFAQVEQAMLPRNGKKRKVTSDVDQLMEVAYQTAEIRTLDAMLRLTRDRLLRSSFRLSRTVQHWKKRVNGQSLLSVFFRDVLYNSMESDRLRLAFAEAAYNQEVIRLGKVVGLLMQRPAGMDDSYLTRAVEQSIEKKDDDGVFSWLPKASNFSLRLNSDGRGKIQFQHYEESINIGGRAAMNVLLEEYDTMQIPWLEAAQDWSLKARSMLYHLLEEALQNSIQQTTAAQEQLAQLNESWRIREYNEPSDIPKQWKTMFELVREIHKVRRVGEGKSIKWSNSNLVNYFQQWNMLGIPSAVFRIFLAQMVHKHLYVPYFPKLQKLLQESYEISMEIITTRFWLPIKDLMTELMYRPETALLTGINLKDEETSLDYMLRDLDFGDGTPATRHEAMLKASRQYEEDMKTGLIRHAIGGRIVRLILIQVQQLKVGMLNAAATVDVLLQTNRFNIQLLAIIPAIVIVTVGTKLFFRFLFTVRVKDLRPMKTVHAEMTKYLYELESILLLADTSKKDLPAIQALNDQELGHFVLSLYDYLVLLDYSSPQPFPNWQCDAIHKAISGFLGPDGTLSRQNLDDQVKLIDQVKRKHNDLAKHL